MISKAALLATLAAVAWAQPGGGPGGAGDGIWTRNAAFGELETFDLCNGHQPGSGMYHHHINPVCLRAQLTDNVVAVSTYKFDFGDYSGLAFYGGIFYPCWSDNSNSTGNNPEGTHTTLDACTAAVIVPPPLALTYTTTNHLVVSWPNPSTGFYLQECSLVSPANWSSNSATPVVVGRQKQVNLTPAPGNWFYRLVHP